MNKAIDYLKTLLYIFLPISILNIPLSILYYFNIINIKTLNIIIPLLIIISMLFGGIYIGKKANKKGYLEGLKVGIIIIILFLITNYFAYKLKINSKTLLYYILLLIVTTMGSMLGINKKKE